MRIGKTVSPAFIFDYETRELKEMGVDITYNLYVEARAGYGQHICEFYHKMK